MSEEPPKTFNDTYEQDKVDIRKNEILGELKDGKYLINSGEFENILELGSGGGGVTQALNEFFDPNQIVALDRDIRAKSVAESNGANFVELDVLASETEKLIGLIEKNDIDLVFATRTSSAVALKVARALLESNKEITYVFSYVVNGDSEESMGDLRRFMRTELEGKVVKESIGLDRSPFADEPCYKLVFKGQRED